jgi:hypothetical protein
MRTGGGSRVRIGGAESPRPTGAWIGHDVSLTRGGHVEGPAPGCARPDPTPSDPAITPPPPDQAALVGLPPDAASAGSVPEEAPYGVTISVPWAAPYKSGEPSDHM